MLVKQVWVCARFVSPSANIMRPTENNQLLCRHPKTLKHLLELCDSLLIA